MSNTAIEWTDKVWNPVTGCTKVSQGCKNCYAERVFPRPYPDRVFTDVRTHEDRLEDPLHWRNPARIFVNSMSDLFHEAIPDGFMRAIFAVMARCPQHTFQVLTKRPARMLDLMRQWESIGLTLREGCGAVLPNVWLGISCEDQKTADERIPLLLQTPAAVRWISAEPLLGPIDLTELPSRYADDEHPMLANRPLLRLDALRGGHRCGTANFGPQTNKLDWVVVGGESGPGRHPDTVTARPMRPSWARNLRDQCQIAKIPFFFKQWGEWQPTKAKPAPGQHTGGGLYILDNGQAGCQGDWWAGRAQAVDLVGKKAAGRLLDGREWSEYPA